MARKVNPAPVNNLVIVSDLHCGCQAGLCPADGIDLDEGGRYTPSSAQKKVWSWWEEFWGEWVPEVCHNEPYAVVVNGDALDGRHHGSTHQVSQNLADQEAIALAVLKPIVEKCEGRFYLIRGTEAHVGPSAENEERLARLLGARKGPVGRFSRQELRIVIGGRARIQIMHPIAGKGSSSYESTAPLKELIESYVEAGCWGRHPYDAVVRSHRHQFIMLTRPSRNGYAYSIITAGWQLKTPFAYKISAGRLNMPQLGGTVLRQGDKDFYPRTFVKSIDPPEEDVL